MVLGDRDRYTWIPLKATPHVRPKAYGPRKFDGNKDGFDSNTPRYHDGKFGSGKWDVDAGNARWKGSNFGGIPVSIPVREVEEDDVDDLRSKNSTPLVGPTLVSKKNVSTCTLVAITRAESEKIPLSVENSGEVAVVNDSKETNDAMRISLSDGPNVRPNGLDFID
ncbi:hypothetical protein ACOSP7_024788 [Xanthoceras sorbifolium]